MKINSFTDRIQKALNQITSISYVQMMEKERIKLEHETFYSVDASVKNLTSEQLKADILNEFDELLSTPRIKQLYHDAIEFVQNGDMLPLRKTLKRKLDPLLMEYKTSTTGSHAVFFQYNYDLKIHAHLAKGGNYIESVNEQYIEWGDIVQTLTSSISFNEWIQPLQPLMSNELFIDFELTNFMTLISTYYWNFYQHLIELIVEHHKEGAKLIAGTNQCRFYINEFGCEQHYLLTLGKENL